MPARALGLICLFLLFSAAQPVFAVPAAPDAASEKQRGMALLISGGLGDPSRNDAMYEGLLRAGRDFGIRYRLVNADTPEACAGRFAEAASGDVDLVISGDRAFQDLLSGHAGDFPGMRFVSVDRDVNAPNVLSVLFADEEGAFLAGAAAALFAGHEDVPDMGRDPALGWVGGMESPQAERFKNGYIQGARHINPQIRVLTAYAGSFDDPAKGREVAAALYAQGARVVMHTAGASGLGVFEAAEEARGYAIGADGNQDAVKPGRILTSLLKRMDIAVWYTAETLINGSFEGGSVLRMNVANAGLNLTDMSTMRRALGGKFPRDLPQRIDALIQNIKGGKIKIGEAAAR